MIQIDVEECLKKFLQKTIKIQTKEKVLKEGRLILFNVKDFYVIFTFKTVKNELKKYEMPIPYKTSMDDSTGVFDYRFECLGNTSSSLYVRVKCLNTNKKSKLYNSVVNITSN
tara:strand:- start:290 stop:628 length:339 start_codon:yes stop_codon:yes gene_type:complete